MIAFIHQLARFAGKNWLRVLIVGAGLLLLSQKQVNFNIRLGGEHPEAVPTARPEPRPQRADEAEATILTEAETQLAQDEPATSLFGSFSLFGGLSQESLLDRLVVQPESQVEAFLRRFSNVAQAEQEKFGIPASIILAQSLLYSKAGNAEAVGGHNAYFGLPCDREWKGATVQVGGQCTRSYQNAWTAFRDNSLYLTGGRFTPLTQFGPHDYQRWAAGMEELELNGTDELAGQLLAVVDKYQLFRFD